MKAVVLNWTGEREVLRVKLLVSEVKTFRQNLRF